LDVKEQVSLPPPTPSPATILLKTQKKQPSKRSAFFKGLRFLKPFKKEDG
jgi:hypothetical protein